MLNYIREQFVVMCGQIIGVCVTTDNKFHFVIKMYSNITSLT